jgi:16S rRNA (cytosine967-C5)-methyltransferase
MRVPAALRPACVAALGAILDDGVDTAVAARAVVARAANNTERVAVKDALYRASIFRLRLAALMGADRDAWLDAAVDDAIVDDARAAVDVDDLVVLRSCPPLVAARLVASLGLAGADAFLRASNRPGPLTVRANVLRTSRDALAEELRSEGVDVDVDPLSPWALTVHTRAPLLRTRAWARGAFEVQDAASQRVVVAADAQAGNVVVDVCAGRGGKTLALAAQMGDDGVVVAEDVDDDALAVLAGRARRLGLRCVRVRGAVDVDGDAGSADVVVVDAPCTSLGVLRRSPDLRFRLSADDVAQLGPVQRAVLLHGLSLVKPGGRLVYATCSVLLEENDAVVDDVVADVRGAGVDVDVCARDALGPHTHTCDGFFIATLRKNT